MTSPDPVPLPPLPLAAIVTTEGTTFVATDVTAQALTVVAPAEPDEAPGEADGLVAVLVHPPTAPPTTSATPAAAHGSHRREFGECFDAVIAVHLRKSARDAERVRGNEEASR